MLAVIAAAFPLSQYYLINEMGQRLQRCREGQSEMYYSFIFFAFLASMEPASQ